MENSIKGSPDTLIWLGVGQAADLSSTSYETRVVLVDANPRALKILEKQHHIEGVTKDNVVFVPACLAPKAGEAEFFHYNLSEYSALSKATDLYQLFPGLKLTKTETLNTIAVSDFIRSQSLSTRNNALRIDIIDQCLPLLNALAEGGLLSLFKTLELKTSKESLYHHAATTSDVDEFLSQQGYELQTQDHSDPDLPVLGFRLNPLWQILKNTQVQLVEEKKIAKQKQADQSKMLIEKDAKLEEQTKTIADINAKLEEHDDILAEKETKLFEVNKQRDEQKSAKEEQTAALKELQSQYKKLQAQNSQLQAQIKDNGGELELLKAELLKAEAQIILIRDLFFKSNTFQGPGGQ